MTPAKPNPECPAHLPFIYIVTSRCGCECGEWQLLSAKYIVSQWAAHHVKRKCTGRKNRGIRSFVLKATFFRLTAQASIRCLASRRTPLAQLFSCPAAELGFVNAECHIFTYTLFPLRLLARPRAKRLPVLSPNVSHYPQLILVFYCADSYLGEANVDALLTEALTADVQAVLADQTSLVRADTAIPSCQSVCSISFLTLDVRSHVYSVSLRLSLIHI